MRSSTTPPDDKESSSKTPAVIDPAIAFHVELVGGEKPVYDAVKFEDGVAVCRNYVDGYEEARRSDDFRDLSDYRYDAKYRNAVDYYPLDKVVVVKTRERRDL